MAKTQNIYDLLDRTIDSLRQRDKYSQDNWLQFLHSAAWNYKQPFISQVLIYAQRPDATACAPFGTWTSKRIFNRKIRAGAKGIAVLDDSNPQLSLQYLFDISDTVARKDSMPVPIWHMTSEKESVVRKLIFSEYFSDEAFESAMELSPTDFFQRAAQEVAKEHLPSLLPKILACSNEALDGVSSDDAEGEIYSLLINSITAAVMLRCELAPDLSADSFDGIQFIDRSALPILGDAIQSMSYDLIQTARKAVRTWDKQHKEELLHDQHGDHISAGRRVPDSEYHAAGAAQPESIRSSSLEISEGDGAQPIHAAIGNRSIDFTSTADRGGDLPASEGIHGSAFKSISSPREVGQQPGVEPAHGADPSGSRGRDPAEDRVSTVTDEDILYALRLGGRLQDSKYRIVQSANPGNLSILEGRLKAEYGSTTHDGISFHYPDGKLGFIEPQATGLKFSKALAHSISLTWQDAAGQIFREIAAGTYLNDSEKAGHEAWQAVQTAKDARTILGEEISTFFASHPLANGHSRNLNLVSEFQEQVRAFIYENSVNARAKLAKQLDRLANAYPQADTAHMAAELLEKLNAIDRTQPQPSAYDKGIDPGFLAEPEQDTPNSVSRAEDLKEGDIISLPGGKYLVESIADDSATLQIVDNPLFSHSLPLSVLNTLLHNAHFGRQGISLNTDETPVPPDKSTTVKETTNTQKISPPHSSQPTSVGNVAPQASVEPDSTSGRRHSEENISATNGPRPIEALQFIEESVQKPLESAPETHFEEVIQPTASEKRSHNAARASDFTNWDVDSSVLQTRLAAAGIHQEIPPYAGDILLAREAGDGFLKASPEDIRIYFDENPSPEDRIAYLKSTVYAPETFYEFGPEGKAGEARNRKGLVARDNGVTIWLGDSYINASDRTTYDWMTVQSIIDATIQKDKGVNQEPTLFDFIAPTPFAAPMPPETDPEQAIAAGNYRLPDHSTPLGGPKARFQNNIAAIRLLKKLESEDRAATHVEQEILDKYVGWGGLDKAFDPRNTSWEKEYQELKALLTDDEYESARESTLTAFFTPPEVSHAIYAGLSKLGFQRGNILDPCCGTGKFLGALPESMSESQLYAIEKDSISGRIAKKLYPDANIQIRGYEETPLQDNLFDVAVGNVPFGDFKLYDNRYNKQNLLIHDYFFAKTLDKVRPGGIIAFVTSQGTMDKKNSKFREYLSQRADLLGAIRLPNDTFHGNAGTDVTTDILFLQKREQPTIEQADWVDLDKYLLEDPKTGIPMRDRQTNEFIWSPEMNEYFARNPEMVLGTMTEVSGPHGMETVCLPRPGHDLTEELEQAIANLEGNIEFRQEELLDREETPQRRIPADPNVRNFSFTLVDGQLYYREDSEMVEVQTNKTATQRICGMVELRDTLYRLIDAQMENEPDEEVERLQSKLNSQYDKFVDKFGRINTRGNDLAFSDDSAYYLLCSLENIDEKTGEFISKADIFHKRTIAAREPVTHTETAKEALVVSMSERGAIDFGYMTKLCGKDEATLKEELRGEIFPDPEKGGKYVLAATYLSGNIRLKLKAAKKAAQINPTLYGPNVKSLEDAIPAPLEPADISVRLGATWIPQEIITQFIYELLDTREHYRDPKYSWSHIAAYYNDVSNIWTVKNKDHSDQYNEKARSTYGTSRVSAYRLIEDCLNMKNTKVFDTEYVGGKDKRVLNAQETLDAQDKQEAIQKAFQDWIWRDVDRAEQLAAIYNEKYNAYRPPVYDGDMVVFHGMNPNIQLRPHQKNAVARMLFGGNTLLDHDVGAGKTWTMVGAAMEGKYLGLCNKTIIAVPNHLVGQWASSVYQLYPSANILAATRRDFETKNRKKFCSRIATGDYDIVILGHSQFGLIPLSAERQKAGIASQIEEITDAIIKVKQEKGEDFTIKQMERMKRQLQMKAQKLNEKRHDDVITFEQLGADRLYVDESHEFKNLFLYTKMSNVAGISQTDSQRASDLFLKCRYLDELTGYKGTAFATGTAISNTMAEMYTNQRYLQYNVLEEAGLTAFDAWASLFGEVVTSVELAPEGNGFRARTRFANFNNLPELLSMYHLVADTQTIEMMDLPLPEVQYDTIPVPASKEQKEYVKSYGERAERIRNGGVDPSEDNMLCITNDGRKLALDQRLIDPTLPDDPNSKVNTCAKVLYQHWQEGSDQKLTQVVFCDISTPKKDQFNVYDDLKQKLVAMGIPAEQIRFVHEAKTEAQKEAMFSQVRSGDIRILMGSTGKLGTGTNIQERLSDGYDLDCPWRPSDLEQRAGRVVRQGNTNDLVRMHRFVTEGTFDAYMYQLIETKQRFISQIRNGSFTGRSAADIDQTTLNYAEIKALATGDPRIREKVELEIDVSKLSILESKHKNNQFRLQRLIEKTLPDRITSSKKTIAKLTAELKTLSQNSNRDGEGNLVKATVKGRTFDTLEDCGKYLFDALSKVPAGESAIIGSLRGIAIQAVCPDSYDPNAVYKKPYFILGNKLSKPVSTIAPFSSNRLTDVGLMRRFHAILDNLSRDLKDEEQTLSNSQHLLESSRGEYGKVFDREDELQEKRERLKVLTDELNLDNQSQPTRSEHTNEFDADYEPQSAMSQDMDLNESEDKNHSASQSLSDMVANAAARQRQQASYSNHSHEMNRQI